MSEINPRMINPRAEVKKSLSLSNKFALWVTTRVGTMGFFGLIVLWSAVWLSWNIFAPAKLQFDPAPAFVAWLFISNVIQICLMPLIMVGQNIQGTHSDARAKHDLAVNVKAEKEIQTVLAHLEKQNELLMDLVKKLEKA